MIQKIILASASPRRRALLMELAWDICSVTSGYEEKIVSGETAELMTSRFAVGKAEDVFQSNTDAIVIGADTAVVIEGEILGKPKDETEACEMLKKLQGKTHTVLTAVALVAKNMKPKVFIEKTDVTFRKLSENDIKSYISTGESMDKAGAYAIQGHGMLLVERICGCYFNVVGLPIERLSEELAALGFNLSEQWRH